MSHVFSAFVSITARRKPARNVQIPIGRIMLTESTAIRPRAKIARALLLKARSPVVAPFIDAGSDYPPARKISGPA
jgi:hypothetical protein